MTTYRFIAARSLFSPTRQREQRIELFTMTFPGKPAAGMLQATAKNAANFYQRRVWVHTPNGQAVTVQDPD